MKSAARITSLPAGKHLFIVNHEGINMGMCQTLTLTDVSDSFIDSKADVHLSV